jgi:hypothetical protein
MLGINAAGKSGIILSKACAHPGTYTRIPGGWELITPTNVTHAETYYKARFELLMEAVTPDHHKGCLCNECSVKRNILKAYGRGIK